MSKDMKADFAVLRILQKRLHISRKLLKLEQILDSKLRSSKFCSTRIHTTIRYQAKFAAPSLKRPFLITTSFSQFRRSIRAADYFKLNKFDPLSTSNLKGVLPGVLRTSSRGFSHIIRSLIQLPSRGSFGLLPTNYHKLFFASFSRILGACFSRKLSLSQCNNKSFCKSESIRNAPF